MIVTVLGAIAVLFAGSVVALATGGRSWSSYLVYGVALAASAVGLIAARRLTGP